MKLWPQRMSAVRAREREEMEKQRKRRLGMKTTTGYWYYYSSAMYAIEDGYNFQASGGRACVVECGLSKFKSCC